MPPSESRRLTPEPGIEGEESTERPPDPDTGQATLETGLFGEVEVPND
jgi:hypothetical protein